MSKRRLIRIQGCLLGVAIGDALGMPVETLSRAKILEVTGGASITSFSPPLTGRDYVKDLKPGDTTDDWQLTEVVADSIIRMRGFNLADIAVAHVSALETTTFGWGGTTESAIKDIRDGKRSLDQPAPDYGPNRGAGNGVIMKVAPLALYHAMTHQSSVKVLFHDVSSLGNLTHRDNRASMAAYAVTRVMFDIFHHHYKKSEQVLSLLPQIIAELSYFEGCGTKRQGDVELTSTRLEKLLNPEALESSEALEAAVGNKFHCLDTMAFAIGTFVRHPTDFRAGVLEAVNAGGDSDTNASIVGALIGLNCGVGCIPDEWRHFSPNFEAPINVAGRFCEIFG